jgi:hypothetical protein
MERGMIVLIICAFFIVMAGCGFLPSGTPINGTAEETGTAAEPVKKQEQKEPEAAAADIIKQVVEEEQKDVVNETNETNVTTETAAKISGSLALQKDLSLCPHLAASFSCNKYDIRRCDFKMQVGKNGTYPNLMNCRDGRKKGENPDNKYCIVQECRPIEEENIAYAHGGMVAFAEYIYKEEKVEGGIMTHYTLRRCGEDHMEFNSSFDCTVYKSKLTIW